MITQEEAYVPQAIGRTLSSLGREDEGVSGFIFMCNRGTKPECYRYRVFGLPAARAEMMQRIAPGTALFLFDFEEKLLYGVYTATSFGRMNLEPDAFGGRFPAQVSFKIQADCLPVPEHSFRRAILENYTKGKFKQDLNGQQVRNLLLLFRPFTMPSSVHRHPVVVNAETPRLSLLANLDSHLQLKSQLNPRLIAFRPHQNYHNEPESQHTGSFLDLAHSYQRVGQHTQPDTRLSFLGDSFADGRHFNHAQTVLPAESALRRSLSSQVTYSGDVTDSMGRYNVPSEQQTFGASAAPLQQSYLPQEPTGSLAGPQYMTTGQAAQENPLGASDCYYDQASSQSNTNSENQPENSNHYYNPYYQASSQNNVNTEAPPQPENTTHYYNYCYQVSSQSNANSEPQPQPENSNHYYNHYYQVSSQSNANSEPQPQPENSNHYYNHYYQVSSQSNVNSEPQPQPKNSNNYYNHYYQVSSQSNVNSEPQPQPENSNHYYNHYYQVSSQSNVNSKPQPENSNRYYSYPNHLTPATAHDPTQQQLYAVSGNTGHANATCPISNSYR